MGLFRFRRHRRNPEADVPLDTGVAWSRETGGEPPRGPRRPDGESTTGTAPSGEYVGRVAGDDALDATESGAERRAEGGGTDDS